MEVVGGWRLVVGIGARLVVGVLVGRSGNDLAPRCSLFPLFHLIYPLRWGGHVRCRVWRYVYVYIYISCWPAMSSTKEKTQRTLDNPAEEALFTSVAPPTPPAARSTVAGVGVRVASVKHLSVRFGACGQVVAGVIITVKRDTKVSPRAAHLIFECGASARLGRDRI